MALAWVQARPGVDSTIIGARTLEQLDQNLAGLDVQLAPQHVEALDRLSAPQLGFPATVLPAASTIMHSGATVNGEPSSAWPLAPANDGERY